MLNTHLNSCRQTYLGTARARMRSGNLPRKFLVQLILLVLHFGTTRAGNLGFYQDVEPDPPMDVNYDKIARYLEAQNLANMRDVNRNNLSPNLPWPYVDYFDYRREKEKKILEALLENPGILDALESRKTKERVMIPQLPLRYEMPEDLAGVNEPEESPPYMRADPLSNRFEDYTNLKIPFVKSMFRNEKPRYVHGSSGYRLRMSPLNNENYPIEDMNAERLMKLEGKLMEINENRDKLDEQDGSLHISEREPPEFTFKFDEPKLNERDTFAIKPNDPRYFEDETSSTESATINAKTTTNREKIVEPFQEFEDKDEEEERNKQKTDAEYSTENIRQDKFSIMKIVLPQAHRRTDPMVVSSTRIMTTDIYFIAIVAGCSAAAMFALVLISLTWCRLHRGAKAAADIEYPAYGVTGPNKDISPSGDQRLAHSAQMYHFQHQKQQIIAMENRTAASRDPGSVSEAESDEENEEGDYTVYECPGLASTGEMEVKNPMFHDDPTPATPPQIHKEEDHI